MNGQDDESRNTPWYVRFVYQYGLPAAIAIYLLSFVVAQVDSKMESMNDKIDRNASELATSRVEHNSLQGQLIFTNLILQRICVNTATDQAERSACFNNR